MPFLLRLSNKLNAIIASRYVFFGFVGLFLISSLWVASASMYPMAFDEDFHMGLIRIYADSLLPYGIDHTSAMATYGSATADPSYLFHYLLSFPYRFLDWIGMPEDVIVMFLRLINIASAVASLFVYRLALRAAGVSSAIINVTIAFFTLIPILPVLAGQVNYDNLLLFFVAWAFYLAMKLTNSIRTRQRISIHTLALLLIVVTFGISVKYAFIPIALGIILWLLAVFVVTYRRVGFKSQFQNFWLDIKKLTPRLKIIIATLFVIGTFFSSKYIVNQVQYGNPIPPCDIVFSENECKAYGPWNRNYLLKQKRSDTFQPLNFAEYLTEYWLPDMAERLTFAVAGPTNDYQTVPSLLVLNRLLIILAFIGAACVALFLTALLKRWPIVGLTVTIVALYVVPLCKRLYDAYVTTGEPVAINGRYLLPLMPFMIATCIIAINVVMQRIRLQALKPYIAVVCLSIVLLGGGGVATYVLHSERHWHNSGWGQESQQILQGFYHFITINETKSEKMKH